MALIEYFGGPPSPRRPLHKSFAWPEAYITRDRLDWDIEARVRRAFWRALPDFRPLTELAESVMFGWGRLDDDPGPQPEVRRRASTP